MPQAGFEKPGKTCTSSCISIAYCTVRGGPIVEGNCYCDSMLMFMLSVCLWKLTDIGILKSHTVACVQFMGVRIMHFSFHMETQQK